MKAAHLKHRLQALEYLRDALAMTRHGYIRKGRQHIRDMILDSLDYAYRQPEHPTPGRPARTTAEIRGYNHALACICNALPRPYAPSSISERKRKIYRWSCNSYVRVRQEITAWH